MFDQTPLIIDCFAGGGGASTGIERALGRSPDYAINHDAAALALHAANHPDTIHLNSNIWDVDPMALVAGRKVGLLWASPDCKHFSKAKGSAPRDRNIRDLAWVVIKWAEEVKPDVILMENVEEFKTWGPLGNDGQPIKEFSGQTFELWIQRLRKTGYKVQFRELRACDYGAPTIRNRFFMIARRDGKPIIWPKPTHGEPNSLAVKAGKRKPWKTAASCIDFTLPCPSIFDTSEAIKVQYGLRAVRPLAKNTMARIARGTKRYVIDAEKPFIVSLTHGGRIESADDPFKAITGARRGEKAWITPSIQKFNTGATGHAISEPLSTITANSWQKRPGGAAPIGMIAPSLMSLKGTARRDSDIRAPHPTVLAGGGHSAMITPILTYAQHGGRNRNATAPAHTITASRKDQNAIIAPSLAQIGYGEAKNQKPRVLDINAPLGTVVAGSIKHAVVAPSLSTFSAFAAKFYGTGTGQSLSNPLHTITTKDRFLEVQARCEPPAFSSEHETKARAVAAFMREHGEWDGGEFVTVKIGGETFVIVDIGLRMLTPRELFNAQGFPNDYVIEGVWKLDQGEYVFKPFPKHTQVSCCGNSVPPDDAEALISANCQNLSIVAQPSINAMSEKSSAL